MKKLVLLASLCWGLSSYAQEVIEIKAVDSYPVYGSCEGVSDNKERCFTYNITQAIFKDLKYPEKAMKKGIEGVVYLSFVIEKDGSFSSVEVMKSPDQTLSNEVLRVMAKLKPCSQPAYLNGQAVATRYTQPVRFRLDD